MKKLLLLTFTATILLLGACKSNEELSQNKEIEVISTEVETIQSKSTTVSGVVTSMGGSPINGATVLIKGSPEGTVTNIDGSFDLKTTEIAPFGSSFYAPWLYNKRVNP